MTMPRWRHEAAAADIAFAGGRFAVAGTDRSVMNKH
jgi:hypothetical protein